jgi:hypothetical protein
VPLRPRGRRLALLGHVVVSVGWLGAVAVSLVVGVGALVSEDLATVRGAYLVLELVGWYALVPASVASLVTGLISSLGTSWGLFRHYWVVIKLAVNLVATGVLLLYMETLEALADRAGDTSSPAGLDGLRSGSPVLHASGALVLLLVATVLAVYKPRGLTRYGWRRQQQASSAP